MLFLQFSYTFSLFRTLLQEREENEQQLQQQVKFYQDELQRESEDNEVLRNTLSHLEEQINSDKEQRADLESKLVQVTNGSESLNLKWKTYRKKMIICSRRKK